MTWYNISIIIFLIIIFIGSMFLIILYFQNKELKKTQKEIHKINKYLESKIKKEIKRNQKQQAIIYQEKKMADLGMMLGAIAHQWKQPIAGLSILLGNLKQFKEMELLDDETLKQHLDYALSNTKYLADTVETFQNFYKQNKKALVFDVIEAINDTNIVFEPFFKNSNINIVVEKEKDKCPCFNFKNEFQQIISSLILNSKDALLSKKDKSQKTIVIKIEEKEDDYYISVEDNGLGIEPVMSETIFQSFKTTKGDEGGTGNGLYISRLIAQKKLMGDLTLASLKEPTLFLLKMAKKI